MVKYWPLLIWFAVVALTVVYVAVGSRKRRKPQFTEAVVVPPASAQPEPVLVAAPRLEVAVPEVPAPAEQSPADEASNEVIRDELAKLLAKRHLRGPSDVFGIEGRYNHRSGGRFTVAYREGLCTVVHLGSAQDTTVRRILVRSNGNEVLCRDEPRLPVGATRATPITKQQAYDFTIEGLNPMKGDAMVDLMTVLRHAYRVGDI